MARLTQKRYEGLMIEAAEAEEVIGPLMSQHESEKLILLVNHYLSSKDTLSKYYKRITASRDYRNRQCAGKISLSRFHKEVIRCWELFPKGFVKDLYKLYYYPTKVLFPIGDAKNHRARYGMLEHSNKPLIKVLTEGSFLKSALMTRAFVLFYLMQFAKRNLFLKEGEELRDRDLDIAGDVYGEEWETQFQEMKEAPQNAKLHKAIIETAVETAQVADRFMNTAMQVQLGGSLGYGPGATTKEDLLSRFLGKLVHIELASEELGDWIQAILEKSMGYFMRNSKKEYEYFLDADDPHFIDVDELRFLHPGIRTLFLEDLLVRSRVPEGRVDLYIDISGSMDAMILRATDGGKITSLDFAKALAVEMSNKRLIDQLYLFNGDVIGYPSDPEALAKIVAVGGTNISRVVEQIVQNKRNAIVITDGIDRCEKYCENVYFVGVKGASFRLFTEEAIGKYAAQEQAVIFDGNGLFPVGSNGDIIKRAIQL